MLEVLSFLVATVVVATLGAAAWIRIDEARRPRLLCLMYHRFATPEQYALAEGTERVFTLAVDRFAQQLQRLRDSGYRPVTVDQAVEFVQGRRPLEGRSVLITIDDGARSVATHAEPVLREHGFSAVLFVTTDRDAFVFDVGAEHQRLTDDELRGLDPDVIRIHSHGVTHRPLVELSDPELAAELRDSRTELERITGRPVNYLAIPGNWHDRRVRRMAADAGYDATFVSDAGSNGADGQVHRIRRINVEGCAGMEVFDAALSASGRSQRRLISTLRRLPGKILGPRVWLPLRQGIVSMLGAEALSFKRLRAVALGFSMLAIASLVAWWILR